MNESIHQEITRIRKAYLDSLPFKINDIHSWLNARFNSNYKQLIVKSSPFAEPYSAKCILVNDGKDSLLVLLGGFPFPTDTCGFTTGAQLFLPFMGYYLQPVNQSLRNLYPKEEDNISRFVDYLTLLLYLDFCKDILPESYDSECVKNVCKLQKYNDWDFMSFYNLYMDSKKKTKRKKMDDFLVEFFEKLLASTKRTP